jgi:hypothetical protein
VRRSTLPGVLATRQGRFRVLPDGGAFAGWGAAPWVYAYDTAGRLTYCAHFRAPDERYRAFLLSWTDHPTPPTLTVEKLAGGISAAYASWNGTTLGGALAGTRGSVAR